ncbi:MAG TPA: filamentous hemagglutinin N-terminal domain-containing protein, partial [Steroidobacter sp.]|nr:filamentous hemagglutinin N-terminal domain-containing protein [Steroidobacter sp.]
MASKHRTVSVIHPSIHEPSTASARLQLEILALLKSPRLATSSILSSLLLSCLPQNVSANPQNGVVTAGDATIVTAAPNRVDVVQSSDRAIINWQGFSIDAGETTSFQQPSASSVTLNRVRGDQTSVINGSLNANGVVMLVNPNGVVIGKSGTVDVAGLVATTANIRDDDFLAQRLNFSEASLNPNASVVNEGHITISNQGLAALVAPNVRNSGVIRARLGTVALGAGQTFSLDFQGDGLLSFSPGSAVAVQPRDGQALVSNTGQIVATGGTVQLTASAVKGVVDNVINTSGVIEAHSVTERDGKIILSGGDHGAVNVAGTVDVSSDSARGGEIGINGQGVKIASDARIDASGAGGGGTVNIGHDDATMASVVQIDRGARIDADAKDRGDGGDVVVWSTDSTNFQGTISARGGANGGDGGFVEISSKDIIGLEGDVDLNASLGATGDLLIDPARLTIIDAASGGEQDGAGGDGVIGGGDANTPNNTISRGRLETLSGAANIVLEATGLITVNAMAGGIINLQTDAAHSFTLRSTTTDGIRFLDPNTEIRTQGGDITLEALKTGTLTSIGRLTSNGGDITLVAGGLAQVANLLDAGGGSVSVTSLSGSIQGAGATRAIGDSVSWRAAYGSVGTADAPLSTSTGRLLLATGGNLFVSNDQPLSQLELRSVHTVDMPFVFQLTAPQLAFDVTDTGTDYMLNSIVNAGPLALTFAGDRNIVVGDVNAGSGPVAVTTSAGSIRDDGNASTGITGSTLTLSATGSIGALEAPLLTSVTTLDVTAGSGGGVVIGNTDALNVTSLVAQGGTSQIQTAGNLTLHTVSAAGAALSLSSTGGAIATAGGPNDTIAAQSLNLSAATTIGSSLTPIATSATALNATAGADIYAATTGAAALGSVTSQAGPIAVTTNGNMSVGVVDASSAGAVTLTATEGSITASSPETNVVASTFDFAATSATGNVNLGTAAGTIRGSAGSGGINLTQTGTTTLESLTTTGSLGVASTVGDVTLGALQASSATISAAAGNIADDGNASTALVAGSANLSAMAGSLGSSTLHLETQTPSLTLGSGADIFVDSTLALKTLDITNTHVTPGRVNTLVVDAPYLQFDVTDTGSQFLLTEITGVTLDTLSFTGDQTSELTKLYANGSVSVRATQGDLINDSGPNSANTRLTGSSISLTADRGNLGTATDGGALETNTSTLTAAAGGNIYVNDIRDLNNLTVRSTHDDPAQDYQFVITAPSLRFDITDSAAGYALTNVSDASGLTFTFEGDRTITAGTIDTTRGGSVTLRSSAGSVLDDGDKATQILADRVSLRSDIADVGSQTGNGFMDVIARQLQGNAAGSYTVALPYSANTTSSNTAVTLNNINAGGPVTVTLDNGDLRISDVSSAGAVALTASNGSILSSSSLSATGLTLSASGAMGSETESLQTQVSGNVTANAAGGGLYLTNTGSMDLLTASAAGPLSISTTGDIVAGAISAAASPVTL